jgi:SAM-dependent methyltransferase
LAVALELADELYQPSGPTSNSSDAVVGVVSAISPWVEYILWKSGRFNRVITVDYNPPIVCGVPWIKSKNVTTFASEVESYDLLVSFSGIEHSGLGRYGDPINEAGDVEAMEQMHSVLRPGGILLLAIPTATPTHTVSNWHRMYGADRLALLLEGRFSFLARVWEGKTFGGWTDVEEDPKLFPGTGEVKKIAKDWMNQHVLVLQKQKKLSDFSENGKNVIQSLKCDGAQPIDFSPLVKLTLIYVLIMWMKRMRHARDLVGRR